MKDPTPTVFIVDDDEAVRSSLRLLIRSVGLQAQAFGSAQEFLATYDPDQPGCLVLDVRMPGMSGLELQQELNRRGATIPVMFITGHGDVPMAVEAMQHGAFDFLQKPFRDQDLLDRVQRALARDTQNRAAVSRRARRSATRLADADAARARGDATRDDGQGQQGHRRGAGREPAHRGNPPRARHGKDAGELAGRAWCAWCSMPRSTTHNP